MAEREKRAGTAEATARSSEGLPEAVASSKETASPRKTLCQSRLESLTYKKYPGQQQVDLSVRIDMPGNWFRGTALGGLSTAERKEKYVLCMCPSPIGVHHVRILS